MKRSAAQYALLTRLLDELLELEGAARAHWLAELPSVYASQRPALDRMLTLDRAASNRKLKSLETQLRSSARGVRALCKQVGCDG